MTEKIQKHGNPLTLESALKNRLRKFGIFSLFWRGLSRVNGFQFVGFHHPTVPRDEHKDIDDSDASTDVDALLALGECVDKHTKKEARKHVKQSTRTEFQRQMEQARASSGGAPSSSTRDPARNFFRKNQVSPNFLVEIL